MATAAKTIRFETMGDLLRQLGGINPRRVRLHPPPGEATERDLIRLNDHSNRLYELVDGVLVEKDMGYPESTLTCDLIGFLQFFLADHPLGFLVGPDGATRLMPRLVRIPDISFVSWDQLPTRERPVDAIADVAPALAIEILSKGNTRREMARKLKEYFRCGVRAVWFVDARKRTVQVFTSPDQSVTLTASDTLDGGELLPGFTLSVRKLFAALPALKRGRGKQRGK
jgi:Uma2 family endonuclease